MKKEKKEKRTKKEARQVISKRTVWLSYFLDSGNPETYLNREMSAKAAGYKCDTDTGFANLGAVNFQRERERIKKWMEEVGLSDDVLKLKLIEMLNAYETKFFAHEGRVTDERLVKALSIQLKALDMALDVRGLKAKKEVEHSGAITIEIVKFCGDATK